MFWIVVEFDNYLFLVFLICRVDNRSLDNMFFFLYTFFKFLLLYKFIGVGVV